MPTVTFVGRVFPACYQISLSSNPLDWKWEQENLIGKIWDLVLSDPPLFQALDDLIVLITLPHHAAVDCARAIEGLRNLVAARGATVSRSWEQMRNALQLDRSFLQPITDTSTAPRHGDRNFIPGTTVTEIVRRSWIIMDRFLEYQKRGNISLPATDFPLLAG